MPLRQAQGRLSRQPAGRRRYDRFSAACEDEPFQNRLMTWLLSLRLNFAREKAAAHYTGSVPPLDPLPLAPQALLKSATGRVGI
jgi:hypothetical protein